MLKSKWIPSLLCVCFLVASYTSRAAYRCQVSDVSWWTIYSSEGQLGWATVRLAGPDPEREFETTAEAALKAYVDKRSTSWITYHYNSKSQSQTPNDELNTISYKSAGFSWLFMTLSFAVGAFLRGRKRKADEAGRDGPTDAAASVKSPS